MASKSKFSTGSLKGGPARLRDRMKRLHLPPFLIFMVLGIASTIWFLVRVIPKPSRASYPCMRVAAPFMSGLIVYLLSVGGLTVISRRLNRKIFNVRFLSALLLIFGMVAVIAMNPTRSALRESNEETIKTGPDDGPNHPIGRAAGVNPGRVVWAWDTTATKRECRGHYFDPVNNDQRVISRMFDQSVEQLAGKSSVAGSWDAMFRYFNERKHGVSKGYAHGEKIFIKINQTSGRGRLRQSEREQGHYYYPAAHNLGSGDEDHGTCETDQYIVLQLLRHLVRECGVEQSDIAIGDPQNPTYGHNYDAWSAEFPGVIYTDRTFDTYGRTLIHPTSEDLLFYSDKFQTDKLYDIIEHADYLINVANLKPHSGTGITLTAKNHFGSQSRSGAYHLHYSHLSQIEGKPPTNAGYHKYRVLVDLMGSKYLGRNTLLYVIDGLYAGGASEGGPPVKYYMAPFNGNWSSSLFISQDQVALESVCYDFLRTEWNGTYSHDPSNNYYEAMPDINGVDDYLHQAADSSNWPKGIAYDPDNSGKPLPSLGVHEHWNDPVHKQYSRNLGRAEGIELVAIPGFIVGPKAPGMTVVAGQTQKGRSAGKAVQGSKNGPAANNKNSSAGVAVAASLKAPRIKSVIKRSFEKSFRARMFYAGVIDDNNGKYFLTDAGIVRGDLFSVTDRMSLINVSGQSFPGYPDASYKGELYLRNMIYELSANGPSLWLATPGGAVSALLPEESRLDQLMVYDTSNSSILTNDVLSVAHGRNQLRWFATAKGISALAADKWLKNSYGELYPEDIFRYYPITGLATNAAGDTLYAATGGAGVARVYRDKTDAVSGASQYLQWGPIMMPSDTVSSICISRDGTQWIGTNRGVARHAGHNTLENWTVFTVSEGLADNHVRAIAADPYGQNVWIGTSGGLSVYDGTGFVTFTTRDGLISNNILFILIDKNGLVYLGTDKGLMVYADGQLATYN